MEWELKRYFFSISDSVNETNLVIHDQNCEERSQLEVNESVENTSGHSEQSTSVEVGEESEEREENKTASGIPLVKGIQVCSNVEPCSIPMIFSSEIVKIYG